MKFENELKAERPHCNMLLPYQKNQNTRVIYPTWSCWTPILTAIIHILTSVQDCLANGCGHVCACFPTNCGTWVLDGSGICTGFNPCLNHRR